MDFHRPVRVTMAQPRAKREDSGLGGAVQAARYRRGGDCGACRSGYGSGGGADQDRLRHGADRRARRQRQGGAAGDADLARRHQRQGRAARAGRSSSSITTTRATRRRCRRIYTKLLDVDKVDLIVSGYGTNVIAPAMPIVIQHNMAVPRPVRPRGQQRVPLRRNISRCCRPGPTRSARFLRAVLRDRRWRQTPKPQDPGDRRRRRRVSRRTPRTASRDIAKECGLEDRLRQDLPARHGRFHADRPRDPGDQPRHGLRRLLPARLGRHACARPPKSGSRPGSSAAAWSGRNSPRSRSSSGRCSTASSTTICGSRRRRCSSPASWTSSRSTRRRPPRPGVDPLGWYLPPFAYADLQVLGDAIEGDQEPRPGQARRLHPQPHVQDHRRRHQLRQGRRVGEAARARGAVAGHQGHGLDQFKDTKTEAIIAPSEYQPARSSFPMQQQAIGPCKVSGRCRPATPWLPSSPGSSR